MLELYKSDFSWVCCHFEVVDSEGPDVLSAPLCEMEHHIKVYLLL